MVRPPKSSEPSKKNKRTTDLPENSERHRLKSLAISTGILSTIPSGSESRLGPSRTVLKHNGRDIVKKSQRKNRFMFAFPGLIAPSEGGRVGELKDLGTKNPILYLDFPQGRMKLFGTIVYPKNRYLTLQFPRGGKNVMCEDYFDAIIVFSDACWIGKKEENPEEAHLEFPKEFIEGQHTKHDFTGGAGQSVENKSSSFKRTIKNDTKLINEVEQEGDSSDAEANMTEVVQVTPVRHSARTAGNSIKYTETSSESKSVKSDSDKVDKEKVKDQAESAISTFPEAHNGDSQNKIQQDCNLTTSADKPNKQSVSSRTKLKDTPTTNHGSLVQARISTMFKKSEDKTTSRNKKRSELAATSASGEKPQGSRSVRKVNETSEQT